MELGALSACQTLILHSTQLQKDLQQSAKLLHTSQAFENILLQGKLSYKNVSALNECLLGAAKSH